MKLNYSCLKKFDFADRKKWQKSGNVFTLKNADPEEDIVRYKFGGQFKAEEAKKVSDVKEDEDRYKLTIRGIANAKVVDRMDEVLDPKGLLAKSFSKNPILLLQHDYRQPVGLVEELSAEEDGVKFVASVGFPELSSLTELQKDTRRLVRQKVYRTVSVGFIPKKIKLGNYDPETNEMIDPTVIEEWELLELSIVSVPANQDSVFEEVDIRQTETSSANILTEADNQKADQSFKDTQNIGDDVVDENKKGEEDKKEVEEMLAEMMSALQGMAEMAKKNQEMLMKILELMDEKMEDAEEESEELGDEEEELSADDEKGLSDRIETIEKNQAKLTEVLKGLIAKLS